MTDDRTETITDPAEIRATDEPDERGDFPCCTTPAPVGAAVALDLDAAHVRTDPACTFHDGATPKASRGKSCPACMRRLQARTLLASTDAAVHAAMLAALVRAGVLTEECAPIYRGAEHHHWQQRWDGEHTHEGRRFVTPWEVAP